MRRDTEDMGMCMRSTHPRYKIHPEGNPEPRPPRPGPSRESLHFESSFLIGMRGVTKTTPIQYLWTGVTRLLHFELALERAGKHLFLELMSAENVDHRNNNHESHDATDDTSDDNIDGGGTEGSLVGCSTTVIGRNTRRVLERIASGTGHTNRFRRTRCAVGRAIDALTRVKISCIGAGGHTCRFIEVIARIASYTISNRPFARIHTFAMTWPTWLPLHESHAVPGKTPGPA